MTKQKTQSALRNQVLHALDGNSSRWWEGYRAGKNGCDALDCPYPVTDGRKMNAWLSGFVTATEEVKAAA